MISQDNCYLIRTIEEQLKTNMLIKHVAGSRAYGTALPTSDIDIRGVFVADRIHVETPFFPIKEFQESQNNVKFYPLNNFMKLALDCNPNIVETLWIDQLDIIYSHHAWKLIRDAAPRLLSQRIAYTTIGYALSQLKLIKGHNKWINNPLPEQPPQQIDFVSMIQHFPKHSEKLIFPRDFTLRDFHKGWKLVPYGKNIFGVYSDQHCYTYDDKTGELNIIFNDQLLRTNLGSPTFIIKFNDQLFEQAKIKWKQYWEWKNNRNTVRKQLEEKNQYDTKHAMHLIRLMRMGKEALTEGVIRVKRPDANELIDIRNGKWTYQEVLSYAEQLNNEINHLVKKTTLPLYGDVNYAAKVTLEVQDIIWKETRQL